MDMWYVNPQLGRGFQQLLQIRTHMWEIVQAVKVAKGKRRREDVCPCCREKVKETPYHHIAECSAFENERRFMIRTLLHSRGTINDIWDTLELVLGRIRPNTETSDEVLLDSVFTPRNKRIATEFAPLRTHQRHATSRPDQRLSTSRLHHDSMECDSRHEEECCPHGESGSRPPSQRGCYSNCESGCYKNRESGCYKNREQTCYRLRLLPATPHSPQEPPTQLTRREAGRRLALRLPDIPGRRVRVGSVPE